MSAIFSRWRSVPVLAYHRVGEPKGDHVPTITPEVFIYQLRYLQRHRYRVVDFGTVAEAVRTGRSLPTRAVAVTFDDGYEETYTVARPALHRFGFCATVFLAPSGVGRPGFMTWQQAQELSQDGFTIGSHTMHHLFLPHGSPEVIRQELVDSKRALEQALGREIAWLSYPIGGYTAEIQRIAQTVGYQAACTTNRGVSKRSTDLFAIRRIKMTERDRQPFSLWIKLSGFYDLFRSLEPPA